jgi:hypothetical protein
MTGRAFTPANRIMDNSLAKCFSLLFMTGIAEAGQIYL